MSTTPASAIQAVKAKHLAFFKMESIGDAYQIANEFAKLGHGIYEISPLGAEAQVIVEAHDLDKLKSDCSELLTNHEPSPRKSVIVRSVQDRLLKAYHSIANVEPEGNLLIAETDFIGELFFLANDLPESIKIVDLRCHRAAGISSFIIVTGDVLSIRDHWAAQGAKVNLLEHLTPQLTNFFKY